MFCISCILFWQCLLVVPTGDSYFEGKPWLGNRGKSKKGGSHFEWRIKFGEDRPGRFFAGQALTNLHSGLFSSLSLKIGFLVIHGDTSRNWVSSFLFLFCFVFVIAGPCFDFWEFFFLNIILLESFGTIYGHYSTHKTFPATVIIYCCWCVVCCLGK